MTNATGFLLRTSLSDDGTLPRSGGWTGCPDIIPAGLTAIAQADLVSSYSSITDKPLTQGLTNYLYLRAKNMNTTPLTQVAYMFQVPGSLILHPEIWYSATNLVGYDVKTDGDGSPDDPRIIKKYAQTLTAQPNQIVVSNGYTWKPDSTEHHCIVGVVADSWSAIMNNYPGGGSMDALAQWIYTNPSFGWHNVTIVPVTSTVYESQIGYAHAAADEAITFTIVAENAPVGARVSFSSNTSTASGRTIGQDWVAVTAPPGGGTVNPDFEVGTTLTVNAGYKTIITYRTDFNGLAVPDGFKMHMKATKQTTPPSGQNSFAMSYLKSDSFARSFGRAHSPTALFHDEAGQPIGQGIRGYRGSLAAAAPWGGDDDDGGDLEDSVVVVVGSHTTTPHSS